MQQLWLLRQDQGHGSQKDYLIWAHLPPSQGLRHLHLQPPGCFSQLSRPKQGPILQIELSPRVRSQGQTTTCGTPH